MRQQLNEALLWLPANGEVRSVRFPARGKLMAELAALGLAECTRERHPLYYRTSPRGAVLRRAIERDRYERAHADRRRSVVGQQSLALSDN